MKEQEQKMKLPSIDDLFTTQEERDNRQKDYIEYISIKDIDNFPNHPFSVNDDELMDNIVRSINSNKFIPPAIVRPKENGKYEMVAGHRRKRAFQKANKKEMPCIIKNLTDDEATILMVDTNLNQRQEILPSEKAFAYKMKLEAMRYQGKRVDLLEDETSDPMGWKLESANKLGKEVGESMTNIRRYIRLTHLIPELLEQVDLKRIAFRPAVELSYLSEENQYVVQNIFEFDEVTPSLSQAIRLKKLEQEGKLTEEKIEEIDKKYSQKVEELRNVYYELEEISRDINEYNDEMEFDEQEREKVETRLDTIYDLKRKYGNNIEEILNYAEEIDEEIRKIENVDEYNNKLKKEQLVLEKEMNEKASKISAIRKRYAEKLNEKINKELVDLEMKNARINVKVNYRANDFFENGKDEVEIFIKTNIGENENELTKIASGGEMSRIMLAIKKVLAEVDNIPVLIFDEIDTGISGKAAKSVAEKMSSISKNHQVLCISHLAAIAAKADYNYFISKKVENERTTTNVKLLEEQEVLQEIARISAGEVNEVTLKYATELRNKKAS